MQRARGRKFGQVAVYSKAASGGGGFTTLNPSDTASGVVVSGGNLVQTSTSGTGMTRSVASHSTGKFYFEMIAGIGASAFNHAVGLANASAVLTSGPGSPDTNSLAYYSGDPGIYSGGSSVGSITTTYTTGDTVGFAVDIGAGLVWTRVNGGNWNGNVLNNPATATGGVSFTLAGALFAMGFLNATGLSNTFNFGGSAFANTAPAGFGNF